MILESAIWCLLFSAAGAAWIWRFELRLARLERASRSVQASSATGIVDVTRGEPTEHGVNDAVDRYRSAFESATVGMALLSTDGECLRVNRAFCRVLGRDPGSVHEIDLVDISHPEDALEGCGDLCDVCAGKLDSCQIERRLRREDGRLVWVALSVCIARDEVGRPLHAILQLDDITASKSQQSELLQAKERVQNRSIASQHLQAGKQKLSSGDPE